MPIDWSLAKQPNVLAMALDGFEQGKKLRREETSRNALASILDPKMAPGGGIGGGREQQAVDYSALTPDDMRTAMTFQGQQQQAQILDQQQQSAQAKAQSEQLQQMGRLLSHATDETTYQQSLAAARQIGLDVSKAPPQFDPQWVGQQRMVLQAFEKDGGQALSSYGKVAIDRGLQPGTPEFAAFVTQAYNADQTKTIPYTQGGGVAGFNPMTGQTNTIVAPNPGGYAAGQPVSGGFQEGQTATNPQTGQKVQFRGGQWVPMGGSGGNVTGGFQP